MRHIFALVITALLSGASLAAPPEVPLQVSAPAGKVKEIVVKAAPGKDFGYRFVGGVAAFREMKGDDPKERIFWLIPETNAPSFIVWWTVGEKVSVVTEVNKGASPVDPPVDPVDPPDPEKVKTVKAFVVYESGPTSRVTEAQFGVVFGLKLEKYLDEVCAKEPNGDRGWKRRDKDTELGADTEPLSKFWNKAKGTFPSIPCVVIEVNGGKPKYVPIQADATSEGTVAAIKKLLGGR